MQFAANQVVSQAVHYAQVTDCLDRELQPTERLLRTDYERGPLLGPRTAANVSAQIIHACRTRVLSSVTQTSSVSHIGSSSSR